MAKRRWIDAEEAGEEQVPKPAAPPSAKPKPEDEPHPLLVLARKHLRRWDIERVNTGCHSWIQTTGQQRRVWIILPDAEGNTTFEEI